MRKGFTLIELLIVVAIIAILAAIAMPNFLQAQVRAKVSRAHSDIRTIAMGLETYRLDRNQYPPENGATDKYDNSRRLQPLTTPMSYLTSLPTDPFSFKGDELNPGDIVTYHYASLNDPMDPNNPFFYRQNLEYVQCQWIVQSNGPDINPNPYQFPRYDPTNGVTSVGNILRYGP